MAATRQLKGRPATLGFLTRFFGSAGEYRDSHAEHQMDAQWARSHARGIYPDESGFTLLELMVTIVVSAVLVAVAIPSYRGLIISNRLTTATNEFVAAINIAKMEAIRRNRPTQFCADNADSNGDDPFKTSCGTTPGAVFVLESGGSTTKLYEAPKVPADINLSLTGAFRFNGQGLAQMVNGTVPLYSGLVADLSTTKISSSNRRCIYMTTGGAISTCSLTSVNGCPTNESSSCQ